MTSLGMAGGLGATVATAGAADAAPLAQGAPVAATVAATVTHAAAPIRAAVPVRRSYTVQAGDTLSKLAQRFQSTVAALAAYNKVADINLIYVGQVLVIPPAGYVPAAADPEPAPTYRPTYQPTYQQTSAVTSYQSYSPSGVWACIAQHESGGNPAENTGNGYYGMYQFTMSSWYAAGGTGNPANASAAEQTAVAQRLQSMSGWGNWPVTSAMCGV